MSILLKGQVTVLGLMIVLALPASGQTDPAAKRIHFTDVQVTRHDDGKQRTYVLSATDADGNTYHLRKIEGRITEFEINGKTVPESQYGQYEKTFDDLAKPPAPPAAPPPPPALPAPPMPPASPLPPAPPPPPEPPRGNRVMAKIIDELIDKGIIRDDAKLIFSLDSASLVVNGVKQKDDVFQVFKQEYIKHSGDHFRYERSGLSTVSDIKTEDNNH